MTEHDRVLDAFRNCITEPKCKDCPWTECETIGHSTIEIPRDLALAVMRELVAQEPRVLTWDEVRERRPFHLWVEDLDTGAIVFPVAYIDETYRDAAMDWCVAMDFAYDDYGKRWRFWDRKPTEEQMEATPWE